MVADVGWAGVLLFNETTGRLLDGHLRKEAFAGQAVPVVFGAWTEEQETKILLSLDPIAAMATADRERLAELSGQVSFDSEALAAMLADVKATAEAAEAETPARQETEEEQDGAPLVVQHNVLVKCANEHDQAEVLRELDSNGLECRALTVGVPELAKREAKDEPPIEAGGTLIRREVKIIRTPRVMQLEGMFDVSPAKKTEKTWRVNFKLDRPWNVGLIVGPSGSGKSTIAREVFGDRIIESWPWPADKSIVDGFPEGMGIRDITAMLSSVGFSSAPSWLKPFRVLSNGEQFRVHLARTLAEVEDLAVVDEFTSVVDRTVAKIGSSAVAKTVRATNRRFVAVACHYDIEEWLQPDWKFDVAANQFSWRSLRRRPEVQVSIRRVTGGEYWPLFGQHHYLSTSLHKAARCFVGDVEGRPAVFVAVLHYPHFNGGWWREHRAVCLPDFQGVGLGNAFSEYVASLFVGEKQYRSTTSHPAMIAHRMRSPMWRMIRAPSLAAGDGGSARFSRTAALDRLTAGFEYVGPRRAEAAKAFGL